MQYTNAGYLKVTSKVIVYYSIIIICLKYELKHKGLTSKIFVQIHFKNSISFGQFLWVIMLTSSSICWVAIKLVTNIVNLYPRYHNITTYNQYLKSTWHITNTHGSFGELWKSLHQTERRIDMKRPLTPIGAILYRIVCVQKTNTEKMY